MADIPTPRSRSQILGEMINATLARLGIPALRVGSPILSILEAAAQSDARSSQDIFSLLNSLSLDRATGTALDRIGLDEGVPRLTRFPASGEVTISDTSFTKISTRIYQGLGAPIVGATTIYVEDASLFDSAGDLYLGRGTTNFEGPIEYTATADLGTYWSITLNTATTRFHNLGETVVMAQGGNRSVGAGTSVGTRQGNTSLAIQFATDFSAVIPDGETLVEGVQVTAASAGSAGNVVAGSVTEFVSPPFSGAAVTNANPFTNGLDTETDDDFRVRIRAVRQSRSRGTSVAIKTGVLGAIATDENRRIVSSSLVQRVGEPVTLYIDDGTGYEEKDTGVALEVIEESATGGEQYFSLAEGRPVMKAYVESSLTAPFALEDMAELSVEVGGVLSTHVFGAALFRDIGNADSYEVASSINQNPDLLFEATTAASGTKVRLRAREDVNEQVQVVAADPTVTDANGVLGFPTSMSRSLWLYKNDRLLNKDGKLAVLTSRPWSNWDPITDGDTLSVEIDGVAAPVALTFNDVDWINAGTPYVTVSQANSLDAWVKVFNYKLPGVTASEESGSLVLTSNQGRKGTAKVEIVGGTVAGAMFTDTLAEGEDSDYTMDRNLGLVKLTEALEVGDRLTASTESSAGFVSAGPFTAQVIPADETSVSGDTGAEIWVVVDGAPETVPIGVTAGTAVEVAAGTPAANLINPAEYIAAAGSFDNVNPGDWLIVTDPALSVENRGAFRIAAALTDTLVVEQTSGWATVDAPVALTDGGFKVIRTSAIPQRVYWADDTYTASMLADAVSLLGATASVWRTTNLRITTNTSDGGDLTVVAANSAGVDLGFELGTVYASGVSHEASAVASRSYAGTPLFSLGDHIVSAVTTDTELDFDGSSPDPDHILYGLRVHPAGAAVDAWGQQNFATPMSTVDVGTTVHLRRTATQHWVEAFRYRFSDPYALTARDQLGLVVDGDEVEGRYVFNTYRRIVPTTNTYGITNEFQDVDNSSLSLAKAFGVDFNWKDFAVHMKSRVIADGILWRYYRHGPEGDKVRLAYTYPSLPDTEVAVTVDSLSDADYTDIEVSLKSSAERTIPLLRDTSYLGVTVSSLPNGVGLYAYVCAFHLPVATATRIVRLNYINNIGAAFTPGNTVVGTLSGANAVIVSATGTTDGYLVLAAPAGFQSGEQLTDAPGTADAECKGTVYGYSLFDLTLPTGVTDHGLAVGNVVWLESTDVAWSSGPRTIDARTATAVRFYDPIATVIPALTGVINVSRDPSGEVSLAGAGGIVTDIFSILSGSGVTAALEIPLKLTAVNDDSVEADSPAGPGSATLTWYPINSTDNVKLFPLDGNATQDIVSAVALDSRSPVSGFVSAFVFVTDATYEAVSLGNLDPWNYLTDGVNWVDSHNTPATVNDNFEFTFKRDVAAGLAINADWENEDVRIVPITADNVVDYLNVFGVSGLPSKADIVVSSRAEKPRIITKLEGSEGSVLVTGGSANSHVATVVGSADSVSTKSRINIIDSEAAGFSGRQQVEIVNATVAPKNVITSTTQLTSWVVGGEVTLAATKAWKYSQDVADALTAGADFQVEKWGNYLCYAAVDGTLDGFASVQEGDWVYISGGTMNPLNLGWFRVIRTYRAANHADLFWVENPAGVEENQVTADVRFLNYDSIIPGDTLRIGSTIWGASNTGTWTVDSIDLANQYKFSVSVTARAPVAQGAVGALGAASALLQVYEGEPTKLIKTIASISPGDSGGTDICFTTALGYRNVGATYGSIVRSLDKLGFGLDEAWNTLNIIPGVDGYRRGTGLLAEANRIVYGDERDTTTYPGIAAAGANINIQAPLLRRIQVGLSVRPRTGVSLVDVQAQVRSAVAAVVAKSPIGEPIAISSLVEAASRVNGVLAITVLSPIYGSGNDLIPVSANEKAVVLSPETDIQISFVGI